MAKKGNAGKVLEGALAGAALGIAATMFYGSKAGKKAQKKAKVAAGKFYRHMAPKVKKMKKVGEAQLKAYAVKGVKEYAKAQKLSAAEEKMLLAEAKRAWQYAQKHLPRKVALRVKVKPARKSAKRKSR